MHSCNTGNSSVSRFDTSLQVIIYDAVTRQVRRQFTRFKDKAYCGTFRSDNKLLVAGGEDGIVQVQPCSFVFVHCRADASSLSPLLMC